MLFLYCYSCLKTKSIPITTQSKCQFITKASDSFIKHSVSSLGCYLAISYSATCRTPIYRTWRGRRLLVNEFVSFLKIRLIFNIFYCSKCLIINFLHMSHADISKSKRCFDVKSSKYYFHMKTKILADIYMCISVPLRWGNILINKTEEKIIQNISQATIRYFRFRWLILFCKQKFTEYAQTLSSLKSPDRNMFGSTRPPPPSPQKLFKLLNN